MSVFDRFVEIGRVVYVLYGPDSGKLAVIVDIVDQNRVLVDGPFKITGVPRQVMNVKRLSLTKLKVDGCQRGLRASKLAKLFTEQGIAEKFSKTSIAKRDARRKARAALNDFDRFKVSILKKQRNALVKREFGKLLAAKKPKKQ